MCHFMFLSFRDGPRWALMGLVVKLCQGVSCCVLFLPDTLLIIFFLSSSDYVGTLVIIPLCTLTQALCIRPRQWKMEPQRRRGLSAAVAHVGGVYIRCLAGESSPITVRSSVGLIAHFIRA